MGDSQPEVVRFGLCRALSIAVTGHNGNSKSLLKSGLAGVMLSVRRRFRGTKVAPRGSCETAKGVRNRARGLISGLARVTL